MDRKDFTRFCIFSQGLYIEEKLDMAQYYLENSSCGMQNNKLKGTGQAEACPFNLCAPRELPSELAVNENLKHFFWIECE